MTINHKKYEQKQLVGSSETIRKTPLTHIAPLNNLTSFVLKNTQILEKVYTPEFDFTQFQPFLVQQKKNYSRDFLSWFIGFSEGDGSFIIDSKNKRLYFTITQKDIVVLQKIRTELGFGIICNDIKNRDIKRFTVTRREHILILIHIFNGNLLLKKTTFRFQKWLNYYNTLTGDSIRFFSRWEILTSKETKLCDFSDSQNSVFDENESPDFLKNRTRISIDLSKQLRQDSVVWKTAWFTGFLEAEGGFSACHRTSSRIDIRFYVDQTNELEILTHIRHLFEEKGSIWIRKSSPGKIHYRFSIDSVEKLELLLNYLKRYPLKSKKNIVYVRWLKLFNILTIIREEKQEGTYEWSEKRHQRIVKLIEEIKKHNKEFSLFLNKGKIVKGSR